ncbi:glycosyltransferase [Enterococcus villorum]|uniref:glycosyltransferase n=1 Tax=Enterococcus villorum TaxID=112904 RepID=UPI001F4DC593
MAVANIWEKRKGLEDVIYFNNQLSDDYKFTIVGKVSKRLPSGITHISRTDSFDVLLDLYREADVFINPTYRDNFPTTNIESLAAGTPVITYDTGGSREAINDNVGFVVKQGSKKEFIEKIIEVKKNKYVRDSCKLQALKYDKANMIKAYIELYEKILTKL